MRLRHVSYLLPVFLILVAGSYGILSGYSHWKRTKLEASYWNLHKKVGQVTYSFEIVDLSAYEPNWWCKGLECALELHAENKGLPDELAALKIIGLSPDLAGYYQYLNIEFGAPTDELSLTELEDLFRALRMWPILRPLAHQRQLKFLRIDGGLVAMQYNLHPKTEFLTEISEIHSNQKWFLAPLPTALAPSRNAP